MDKQILIPYKRAKRLHKKRQANSLCYLKTVRTIVDNGLIRGQRRPVTDRHLIK